MTGFLGFLGVVATVAFPFLAMAWMWRRMKRVRDGAYRASERAVPKPAWEEAIEESDGLTLVRTNSPNDDLIALGAKANQSHWPLSNQ